LSEICSTAYSVRTTPYRYIAQCSVFRIVCMCVCVCVWVSRRIVSELRDFPPVTRMLCTYWLFVLICWILPLWLCKWSCHGTICSCHCYYLFMGKLGLTTKIANKIPDWHCFCVTSANKADAPNSYIIDI